MMRTPVALCALCRQRICAHDDFAFAGLAPVNRSSAGLHAGATLPVSALTPRVETGISHHFAHAAQVGRT